MPKIIKSKEINLPCKLTAPEFDDRSHELASVTQDIASEDLRQDNMKKQMKSAMSELVSRQSRLANVVFGREEYRLVKVDIVVFNDTQVQEVRRDTGEIINTREAYDDERQMSLDMKEPEPPPVPPLAIPKAGETGKDGVIELGPDAVRAESPAPAAGTLAGTTVETKPGEDVVFDLGGLQTVTPTDEGGMYIASLGGEKAKGKTIKGTLLRLLARLKVIASENDDKGLLSILENNYPQSQNRDMLIAILKGEKP